MIGITINRADATGVWLVELSLRLQQPDNLLKILERAGVNALKVHFRKRDTVANRLGGRRTHFWQQMADSTRSSLQPGQLVISITDPRFPQKVFGGTLRPKKARALTIPVNPEAYGRTPAVLEQERGIKLVLIVWKLPKAGGFASLCAKTGGGPNAALEVFYILAKSVRQAPDPDALPDQAGFRAMLIDKAETYVIRILKGGNTP